MSDWDRVVNAARGIPRRFVDWPQWWRSDEPNHHRIYLGASGVAWDACCRHQIADNQHRPYPELSLLAPYLRYIRSVQSATRTIDHPFLLDRHPPLYWDTPTGGELTYIDLDAAYFSLYTRATLDVAYDGERRPVNGEIRFLLSEELGAHKLLRNGLMGTLRRKRRRGVDHGEPFVEEIEATHRRPNLWGLVMDLLELIAWDMRNLGAVYVHTDGYIFGHHDLAEDALEMLAVNYGLTASERARGEGYVSGLGRWRIGDIVHGPARASMPVDNMVSTPNRLAHDLREWCKFSEAPKISEAPRKLEGATQ